MFRKKCLQLTLVLLGLLCIPIWADAQVKDAPLAPSAEEIDLALLQPAMQASARNGIATILARMQVNEGLVVPLVDSSRRGAAAKVTEVTLRYRQETREVERPIRKKVGEREVRRPVTDEYGNVTGYKTVRVPIYEVVGKNKVKVKVLVRDDNGPITRTHKRVEYERDPIFHVPRGTLGLNGMALYVLRKAGQEQEAAELADALARVIQVQTGLPDHTWDLAWLVAGFSGMKDDRSTALHQRLVNKLLDGQVRERGPALGMWGPLCIHHQANAGYLALETKLYEESKRIDKKIGDDEDPHPRLKAERKACNDLMDQVRRALDDTATQSSAFMLYAKPYRIRDDVYLAGLSHFYYSHTLADLDATYLALWALAEADQYASLPLKTHRWEIRRKAPAPREETAKTLANAQKALLDLVGEEGKWPESNKIIANSAYLKIPTLGLEGVGPKNLPPKLLQRQTWRSNLRGLAAMDRCSALINRPTRRQDERLVSSRAHAATIVNQMLQSETLWQSTRVSRTNQPPRPAADHAYHGELFTLADLKDASKVKTLMEPSNASVDQLRAGYSADPYAVLMAVSVLFGQRETGEDSQTPKSDLFDRLAYRLVVQQADDGQWHGGGFGAEITSSEYAYSLQLYLDRLNAAKKPKNKKNKANEIDLANTMIASSARIGGMQRVDVNYTFATLAATAFLLQRIDEPIDMSAASILSPELTKRLDPFAAEEIEELEQPDEQEQPEEGAEPDEKADKKEPKPLTDHEAAGQVIRVNEALEPLLESLKK